MSLNDDHQMVKYQTQPYMYAIFTFDHMNKFIVYDLYYPALIKTVIQNVEEMLVQPSVKSFEVVVETGNRMSK